MKLPASGVDSAEVRVGESVLMHVLFTHRAAKWILTLARGSSAVGNCKVKDRKRIKIRSKWI